VIPSTKDKKYIALALEESLRSNHWRVKIGCYIVIGNYVAGHSHNIVKTHPVQSKWNKRVGRKCPAPNMHAEIRALTLTGYHDTRDAQVYIARFDRNGHLADCRPCAACYSALKEAGCRRIIYTSRIRGILKESIR